MIQLDIFPELAKQQILHGDCLDVMRTMQESSIDFIVTDPPYGLHFMGKEWDGRIPAIEIWAEALRVAKPGAMLAAFGGSRTHHHLMCAIEGAGWEIRDVIMWIYGSGFPKSHNFGRQLGEDWKGYGTALKPSYEPIIIAMRPLDGTFVQNAEKWGVAGINIDESRISISNTDEIHKKNPHTIHVDKDSYSGGFSISQYKVPQGRWPANIIFDEEAAKELDEMTGVLKNGSGDKHSKTQSGRIFHNLDPLPGYAYYKGDSGGASRFFYCAKACSSERNRGLEGMPLKDSETQYGCTSPGRNVPKHGGLRQNIHPTVKPISLMKYILKLTAPPGNPTCLDPFAGSGSTLVAAKELGINCIGIEKQEEYVEIAKQRVKNG